MFAKYNWRTEYGIMVFRRSSRQILIYKLASVNTDNLRGPFYSKNLLKSHEQSLTRNVYMRHVWKHSPSKQTATNLKRPTYSSKIQANFIRHKSLYPGPVEPAIINPSSTMEGSAKFKIVWENGARRGRVLRIRFASLTIFKILQKRNFGMK